MNFLSDIELWIRIFAFLGVIAFTAFVAKYGFVAVFNWFKSFFSTAEKDFTVLEARIIALEEYIRNRNMSVTPPTVLPNTTAIPNIPTGMTGIPFVPPYFDKITSGNLKGATGSK